MTPDVIVAFESSMICGVWSCVVFRSTKGIAVLIAFRIEEVVAFSTHASLCPLQNFADGISTPCYLEIGLCTMLYCSATWKLDLGPRCGPGESFPHSL